MLLLVDICITVIDDCICNINNNNNNNNDNVLSEELLCKRDSQIKIFFFFFKMTISSMLVISRSPAPHCSPNTLGTQIQVGTIRLPQLSPIWKM